MNAAQAYTTINRNIADSRTPLPLFHDDFIAEPGGVAIFFAATGVEAKSLTQAKLVVGWPVEVRPLVFADSPAAFDEQIAFTLRQYRGLDWADLGDEERPSYGEG